MLIFYGKPRTLFLNAPQRKFIVPQLSNQSSNSARTAKHLNVLQIIPTLQTGGAERTTVDIARAVMAAGGHAVVATRGGRMVGELKATGATVIFLPVDSKNPYTIWRNISRLKRLIQRYHISLVHARSRAPAWSGYFAARACGIAFLTTYHGTYGAKSALKRFYNSIMVRGDRVIANSAFIAQQIRKTYPLAAEKIVTIPRGLDLTAFHPHHVSDDRLKAMRHAWGLENDTRPIILLPGRLTRWKGQAVLIQAALKLIERGQRRFVCVLAGDAQGRQAYEEELHTLSRAPALEDRVRIVGHCSDMPAAYALSQVVVSTSTRAEAFGRIAVEAQAMGKAVIATDHGGARETVINGITGWLVAPNDSEALAQALDATLSLEPGAIAALGARARAHVVKTYSVKQMCAKTMAVYQESIGAFEKRRETQKTKAR